MSLDKENIRIEEAVQWRLPDIRGMRRKEIYEAALKFRDNLHRIRMSSMLLVWMIGKATMYQDAATKVQLAATPEEREDKDFQTKCQSKIHAITDALEKECHENEDKGFELDEHSYNTVRCLLTWYGQPEKDGSRSQLLRGFDAYFQSALMGVWTAIEILVEDLHTVATKLLDGKHVKDKASGDRIVNIVQKARNEPSADPDKVKRWTGKYYGFRTLFAARVSYGCWFHTDSAEIDSALQSVDLDTLAQLRNVIAHSAAVPDNGFRDEGRGIPRLQEWLNVPEITLNGEEIRSLVDGALKPVADLVLAVDRWITLKLGAP